MKKIIAPIVACIIGFYTNVPGTVYNVPGGYTSIASALSAAGAGDTIEVDGGTYTDLLNFDTKGDVTLKAVGDSATIVQWSGASIISLPSYRGGECMVAYMSYNSLIPTIIGVNFSGISPRQDTIKQIVYGAFNLYHCNFSGVSEALVNLSSGPSNTEMNVDNCVFSSAMYGIKAGYGSISIRGCKIHNIKINNYTLSGPTGIFVGSNSGLFENNVIYDCGIKHTSVFGGQAISCRNSTKNLFRNNLIYNNGYGIRFENTNAPVADTFVNNTIVNNSRTGAEIFGTGNCVFTNNILAFNGNDDTSSYFDISTDYKSKSGSEITYNLIGRYNSNLVFTLGDTLAKGNLLNIDPAFQDTSNNNYELSSGSPCIDAGDPDVIYNDVDGSRNDMGAFGSNSPLSVGPLDFNAQFQAGRSVQLRTTTKYYDIYGRQLTSMNFGLQIKVDGQNITKIFNVK